MEQSNKMPATFRSRFGFILASVGSAVGMGNIWMFPYRVGSCGGAAFLIPYFLFILLFGAVGLAGEFALGRLTGTGPVGSYGEVLKSRGKRGGKILGMIPLLGSFGIAIGYAVILGWVLRSLGGAVTGSLFGTSPEAYFAAAAGVLGSVPWHLAVVLITVLVLALGVLKGIERVNKVMMPAFFVLFLILAATVSTFEGAGTGYAYLLVPKWEALLSARTWVYAMGQAFFSLSITGSGMIIYGSYLSKKENIVKASGVTALLDTCAALLAGFAIIPAVFAFGQDPASGPPLIFHTLPKVFAAMPGGRIFSVLFFLSVLFAGVTSLVNMFEVCGEALSSQFKLKRKAAVGIVGAVVFGLGLLIEYEPFLGKWMDFITVIVVPFGALLGAIMIYWVMKPGKMEAELALGRKKAPGKVYFFFAKYVYVPLALGVFILGFVYGGIG